MDYKLNREALTICQVVYDGYQEQPIDFEFSLPDYCPDIQKILKCQVTPSIINRAIIGDQLQIDGVVTVSYTHLRTYQLCRTRTNCRIVQSIRYRNFC